MGSANCIPYVKLEPAQGSFFISHNCRNNNHIKTAESTVQQVYFGTTRADLSNKALSWYCMNNGIISCN